MLPDVQNICISFLFNISYILFCAPQGKNQDPPAGRRFQDDVLVGSLMLLEKRANMLHGPGRPRRKSCWEPRAREAGARLLNPAMDDFTTRTYGTSGLDNRPLFGETSARVGGRFVSSLDLFVPLIVKVCFSKSNKRF